MANVSNAFGFYRFTFPKTKTEQEIKSWLLALQDMLLYQTNEGRKVFRVYHTELHFDKGDSLDLEDNYFSTWFTAVGRWKYGNNINTFENEEIILNHFLQMDGLLLNIEFTDYEFGLMTVGQGNIKIEVENNKLLIEENIDYEQLNEDTWVKYDLGNPDAFEELFGAEE